MTPEGVKTEESDKKITADYVEAPYQDWNRFFETTDQRRTNGQASEILDRAMV